MFDVHFLVNLHILPVPQRVYMQIPSKTECFRLMSDMKMMEHIVAHSMQVCRVATYLAGYLIAHHNHLNSKLIRSAALLHDITKTRSFNTREDHALTGSQFLADQGYPEVGDLVRQHVVLDEYSTAKIPVEADILNYADKRVLHDEIVDLDTRLDYILERYAKKADHRARIYLLWEKTRNLENKIFGDLPFSPEDLNRILNAEDRSVDLIEYQKVCGLNVSKFL
jgi:putative nucleotidyltransferase with HDIG domain